MGWQKVSFYLHFWADVRIGKEKTMIKINRLIISICVLTFGLVCIAVSGANGEMPMGQLSKSRYSDPKGYFKIVPPAGWRIQEYPQDSRGKVAFFAPGSNIDLRVLVNAVDFSTIEELIAFCKDVEKRIGVNTNIKRITFGGRPAVERTFQLRGLNLYYIDFLVGKVDHNLAYGAPVNKYNKYRSVVMKSMDTYEPIFHDVSDQEIIKHVVAKKFRLGQLMIQNGNYELALEFVREGLEVSPTDPDLLKLKQQIDDKLRRR
jgi:hypothetical protein